MSAFRSYLHRLPSYERGLNRPSVELAKQIDVVVFGVAFRHPYFGDVTVVVRRVVKNEDHLLARILRLKSRLEAVLKPVHEHLFCQSLLKPVHEHFASHGIMVIPSGLLDLPKHI